MPPAIVLGSRNRHKLAEITELLQPYGLAVASLDAFADVPEVQEDGHSFRDHAEKKAREVARFLRRWVIAEDSGLCVDALGGAPGVDSAVYAGVHGDDRANNEKLLRELAHVPEERRTAHYVCYAVLSDPDGQIRASAEGRCRGRIVSTYRGAHGFGYDPLFLIPEYHQTFGELEPAVKRHISHRARAFERLIPQVVRCLTAATPAL